MKRDASETFGGVLLGTAVGDALGLPAENLSPERIHRLWKGEWRMRFVGRRGTVSDDTEHTLFVAQSLLTHPDDPEKFQQVLAWKLRWWFASLPAGVGLATARACIKLWLDYSARNAAVRSAGSGPAMRSAIIGAFFSGDPVRRRSFVLASSQLTHRSWQAETAALAVAECASLASKESSPREPLFEILLGLSREPEWRDSITKLQVALGDKLSVQEFAIHNGLARGVSGYPQSLANCFLSQMEPTWMLRNSTAITEPGCQAFGKTPGPISKAGLSENLPCWKIHDLHEMLDSLWDLRSGNDVGAPTKSRFFFVSHYWVD
jgi:hypothetical protein